MAINDITVFDLETSGLDPTKERIIEIAAIRVCNGEIVSEFSTLINNGPVTPEITQLTGISNDQLVHGLSEDSAMRMFKVFMNGSILVAHNAVFDLAFLHFTRMRLFNSSFDNDFLDTFTIARDRTPYPHKLTQLCERFEIVLEGAHRALNDVRACQKLLEHFDQEESIEPWINRLGYTKKYGPADWYPDHAQPFEQGYKN
jgi:DNA polymerase-3 subunit epsilon